MECERCGHCCMAVGSTFWTHGDFDKYPVLKKLADAVEPGDDGMPCQMLLIDGGKANCKIQAIYGYDAKPEMCRAYPEFECHRQTGTFEGQGVCSQIAV